MTHTAIDNMAIDFANRLFTECPVEEVKAFIESIATGDKKEIRRMIKMITMRRYKEGETNFYFKVDGICKYLFHETAAHMAIVSAVANLSECNKAVSENE